MERQSGRRSFSRREFLGMAAAGGLSVTLLGGCGGASSGGGGASSGGGGQAKAKKNYRLVLIVGVLGDEFYTTMGCGASAEANKLGVDLKIQGPKDFDPSEQTPILNAAIQSSPDAILIAPTDKTAMIAPIQSAVNQGIPVIAVDTTINKPDILLAHIGSDNFKGGQVAGNALAKAINKKGKVFVVNVKPGISTTDARQKGFEAAIKKYPGIQYLGAQYDNDDPTKAASITSAVLQKNPDLAGIFGTNIYAGEGAATGVRQAGKKGQVKIIEFDASPTEVKDLKKRSVDGLIAQHPGDIGRLGVKMAVDYLDTKKKPQQKNVTTGFTVVTRENMNDPNVSKYLYKAQC
ncbi:MAG: substrate-binding domain-containing protein [Rubrobacteraceae bacterium]|nr:substrate-binding domain-containing protein [Rubrobacteraceae bacterium]